MIIGIFEDGITHSYKNSINVCIHFDMSNCFVDLILCEEVYEVCEV